MKVYSCSPFFNEYDLLDLKVAEEIDTVDKIFLIESNQSLHCLPKPLNLKGNKHENNPKVEFCFIEDEFSPNAHRPNDTIQKNGVLRFFDYDDDDVLICSDLDEINNKKDLPRIIDAASEHGFVKLAMHCYYYKINLQRGQKDANKGWRCSYAITGRELRKRNENIYKLRNERKGIGVINTDGKHFSYLTDPEGIAYKINNAGHPEFMKNKFTDEEKIKERISKQQDPFDRTLSTGEVQTLTKVPVDETYPQTILDNIDFWSKYIAW
jgi:hypothetical protein